MYDFEGQINFDRRAQHGWGFGHKENLDLRGSTQCARASVGVHSGVRILEGNMELATLTFSIAVPIATVVIGYFIQPTLSGWCWRGFLKLSEQASKD